MKEELIPLQNTGVLVAPPKPEDYFAGAESGIVYEKRNAGADWRNWLPSQERQRNTYFDTFACVTFSALNCIETQIKWLIYKNEIHPDVISKLKELGFFDDQGNFNASDRFTAKMSGTTKNGNYLTNVWDSIRKDGLLPEKDWPMPPDSGKDADQNWDAYYSEIPQELKDKAKEFLKYFTVRYEWVASGTVNETPITAIREALYQAPLQIAAPVCPPWNTSEILQPCGSTRAQHATMVYGTMDCCGFLDFDHYNPYEKKLAWTYCIPYVLKGLLTVKEVIQSKTFCHNFQSDIVMYTSSAEVAALQEALKIDGEFFLAPTGFYGEKTRQAVLAFQCKYKVASDAELKSLNGKRVGPKTRAKLNELFNK